MHPFFAPALPFGPRDNPELEEVVKVAGYSRFASKVRDFQMPPRDRAFYGTHTHPWSDFRRPMSCRQYL